MNQQRTDYPASWKEGDAAIDSSVQSSGQSRPIPPPPASGLKFFPQPAFLTAEATSDLLSYNHETFHIFFNKQGFHNHLSHHVLAAVCIGAPASHLDTIYRYSLEKYLDHSFEWNRKPPPGEIGITPETWQSKLEQADQYWHYLDFFEREIKRLGGFEPVIREYIFGAQATQRGVDILARFIGGAVHPLIHVGYGVEFKLDGIIAEGLAMTCITDSSFAKVLDSGSGRGRHGTACLFDILVEMHRDQPLAPGHAVRFDSETKIDDILSSSLADRVADYGRQWDLSDDAKWETRLEELAWFNVLMLGATTRPGYNLRHNFFLMHTHNGVLFLYALLPMLTPDERARMLDAYLRLSLVFWISTGRPCFYITDTLMANRQLHFDPTVITTVGLSETDANPANNSRIWSSILQVTANHLDEHLVKAIRTLTYLASRYSGRRPGSLCENNPSAGKAEDLFVGGLGLLDGTALLRTAIQLLANHGQQRSGVDEGHWYFSGVGFDESYADETPKAQ